MRLFAATLIESLQESGTSNKNLGTLKKLDSSIDTLSALLNSLLDISKLESGEVTLNFSDFQIGELLESVVFEHSAEASSKNLNIQFVASSAVVRSDKVLLRRILSNLVSNATRYTSQGRVLLGCRRKGGNLEIQVWDTGIGISAENLDSIFEEFLQLDNPARQRGLGLGLGLAISKKTSDLLGHNLTVSSRPQKGSVFTVEVPLLAAKLPHKAENTISNPLSTHSAKSSVIMVIDDDSLVLEATESLLEQLGYDVIPAISSKDAIEKTTGETVQPDVVIADFRLPGKLNGVDTIRHIKKNVRTNFAGIIITGDTGHESLSVITESGFQVLHKPIQPQKLLTALEEALATT